MNEFIIPPDHANYQRCVRRLADFLRRHDIHSVLAGVSGGPDSVLTLSLLVSAARKHPDLNLRVFASHANFRLRGEESRRDEMFVRSLSRNYPEVTFFFESFDTSAYAESSGISIEMAARELRHDWWRKLMEENHIEFLATGHNANDNEETLMLNMLRGASPAGLKGMKPLDSRIIRPLLGLYRPAVLALLKEIGAKYVTDSSNLTSDYLRNFLRHEILPRLETRWQGLHSALATTLELQNEANAIIDAYISDILVAESAHRPDALRWSTIREAASPLTLIYYFGKQYGLSSHCAREIAHHIPVRPDDVCLTPGRRWLLPDGGEILTTAEGIEVRRPSPHNYLTQFPTVLDCRILHLKEPVTGQMDRHTKLELELDFDGITLQDIRKAQWNEVYLPCPFENYTWRSVRRGDKIRLFPGQRCRSKLVSDVLKEEKVLPADRQFVVALADKSSDEIIWIPGIRRSGSHLIEKGDGSIWYMRIPSPDDGTRIEDI